MNIVIANRLLRLRKEHGFSQEDLAEKIGISRQSVSKWERAEASPDTDNLIALARLYGVSLDELLLAEENGGEAETGAGLIQSGPDYESGGMPDAAAQAEMLIPSVQMEPNTDEGTGLSVRPSGPAAGRNLWLAFPYPVLVTIAFLLLGFLGGWWHPAWILFLTVPLYYALVDVIVHKRSFHHFPYPVLTVVIFLVLGFFGWWHPGWLVFLTIPLYYALFPERDPT